MILKIHSNKHSSTFHTKDLKQLNKMLLELGLLKNNWLRTTKSGKFFTLKPRVSIEHKRYIEKYFVCKKEGKPSIITGFKGNLITDFEFKYKGL